MPAHLVRIISSYFSERILLNGTTEGVMEYEITGGVPQGSVLGPLLGNLLSDEVLYLPMLRRVQIIGHADDITVIIMEKE